MINPVKTHKMHGNFVPLIDYPEHLSEKGREYFLRSLASWKKTLQIRLEAKLEGMSPVEIMEEEKIERDAFRVNNLRHFFIAGPASILRTHSELTLIDLVTGYVSGTKECSDIKLFDEMRINAPSVMVHDAEMVLEDEFGEKIPGSKKDIKVIKNDAESVDYWVYEKSVAQVMNYFRMSQFDIISPIEQEFLLFEMNKKVKHPDLVTSHDVRQKAYSNRSDDEIDDEIDALYDKSVDDVLVIQAITFLKLYHEFSKLKEDKDNAHHYDMALEVISAFENMQILLQASLEGGSYGDAIDCTNDGRYELSLDYDVYEAYHESKEGCRLGLIHPETLINAINADDEDEGEHENGAKTGIDSIDYDSFTHTFRKNMSADGRKSFDNYVQSTLNTIAENGGQISVNVAQVHELIIACETLRIT